MIGFEQKQENKSGLRISWQGLRNILSRNSELAAVKSRYGVPLTNAGREVKLAMDKCIRAFWSF